MTTPACYAFNFSHLGLFEEVYIYLIPQAAPRESRLPPGFRHAACTPWPERTGLTSLCFSHKSLWFWLSHGSFVILLLESLLPLIPKCWVIFVCLFVFYSLESLTPCPFYLPQRVKPNINWSSGSATADFISTIVLVSQGWGIEGGRKEAVIIELEQSFTSMPKNNVILLIFLPVLRSNVSCTSELKCTLLSWNLGYKPWLNSSFFFSRKILCSQSRCWVDQHGLGNLYCWRKILMGGSKLGLCCDVWSITNLHPRLPPPFTFSSLSPPDLQCSSNAFSSGQVGSRTPAWRPFTLQRPQQSPCQPRME